MLGGALFGVASAVAFGVGDFSGALATRRSATLAVVAGAQLVGLLALMTIAILLRPPLPDLAASAIAVGAGLSGVVGLGALYRGMSLGSMGLVTSLSGSGALTVPLFVSAVTGAVMAPLQLVGVLFAAAAAAAAGGASRGDIGRQTLGLALLAALGFGGWYVLLDLAAASGDPLWALVISRGAAALVAGVATVARGRERLPARLVVVAGIGDIGGNAFYVLAGGALPVGLAAALTGMYPVVTILLARLILGERLSRFAQLAVLLALVGIVLISAGGELR
jgi:drug/metabolite transporter (DMT)-like permease